MGLDVFKAEVEKLLGYNLEPARDYHFDSNVDEFGWATGADGKSHCTMYVLIWFPHILGTDVSEQFHRERPC